MCPPSSSSSQGSEMTGVCHHLPHLSGLLPTVGRRPFLSAAYWTTCVLKRVVLGLSAICTLLRDYWQISEVSLFLH